MSFPNSPGGTLTLPSPTHGHKLDVPSAVRNLRRSLSRSPSKLSLRASYANDNLASASQQSPCRRNRSTPQQQQQFLLPEHSYSAPPVTDSRPAVRLSLRALKASRTASPSRPLARARASPKSPLRRALNNTADSGNATQQPFTFFSAARPSTGQENKRGLPSSSAPSTVLSKPSRHSLHLDVSGASENSWLKSLGTKDESSANSTTGALKRSDATMNLDQPNQGSPVAKRRSLHGISSLVVGAAPDFSIFGDQSMSTQSFDIHEDAGTEYELTSMDEGAAWRDAIPPPTPSYLPRRTSSLRKSTLQQRYGEKSGSGFGRRNGEKQLAQMGSPELSTPAKNRPRLSNDQFCPPPAPRDSIFSSSIPLPSASVHMMDNKGSHQPHPLSKILSTSSSGNSLTEETSQYVPAPPPEKPKAHQVNPFSRSLPLTATRPTAPHDPANPAAATPYQKSSLYPNAFHSTGLVSKVNRNIDDDDKKLAPPDTPCKKHNQHWAATFPPPSGSAIKKKKKTNNRNSFNGLPSTPFGPAPGEGLDTFGNQGRGLHLFQRASVARSNRRGSFLFNNEEVEEQTLFQGDGNVGSGSTVLPPTPTKNSVTPSVSNLSNLSEQSLDSPSANRTAMPPTSAVRPPPSRQDNCEYTPAPPGIAMHATEDAGKRSRWSLAIDASLPKVSDLLPASFSRSRAQRALESPAPLGTSVPAPKHLKLLKTSLTKTYDTSASPVSGRRTPQTPQDSLLPLDGNRFNLSQASADGSFAETNMPPPVTPTTVRDFRSSTSILVTPVNGRIANLDVDSSLYSRFDKVEQVGKGEFSTVYRVEKNDGRYDRFDVTSTTPQGTPRSPAKGQVFAVKKSRHPYQGNRDREIKLREAQILRALSNAEHVVHYVDDWEHQLHLYIQTEYCEEGNLEKFLGNIGFGGRLDDFRIFKILQDLCLVSHF